MDKATNDNATKNKTTNRLRPKAIASLKHGWHHDGAGLYLQVDDARRNWVLRWMRDGKARKMGLGSVGVVGLSDARKKAQDLRELIAGGRDPLAEKEAARQAAKTAKAASITFEEATDAYLNFRDAEWKNEKHKGQWRATMATYAYPVIGKIAIRDVTTEMVCKILEPIWMTKTETATRIRQRIEKILNSAYVKMNPKPENPARWIGHLADILPKPTKIKKAENFAAMDYHDVPAFVAELKKRDTVSARALLFTLLTAARTNETQSCNADQIADNVWTIPGELMKGGRDHRVPLVAEALALLPKSGIAFTNKNGDAISNAAMLKYLQEDMKRPGLTVHGFRATFKTWASDCTNFPNEVVETALAHIEGDKAEKAYSRRGAKGDKLDRRRKLMEAWARYCLEGRPASGEVVAMRAA